MIRGRFRALVITTIAAWACDTPIEPDPFGTVSVRVVVSAEDLANSAVDAARLRWYKTSDGGPGTTRTMTVANDTARGSITGLEPGSYTVAVEGTNGGALELFGEQTVNVAAGNTATPLIIGRLFTPTLSGLPDSTFALSADVSYPITRSTDATAYDVEWGTSSADFTGADSVRSAGADTTVTVSDVGTYYVRARARNKYDVPGVWSAVDSFDVVGDTVGSLSADANDLGFAPTLGMPLSNLNIAPSTDVDWFRLYACRQDMVTVETFAARLTPASQLDTHLELFASDLTSLGVSDDEGASTDSRVSITLGATDTVFMRVSSADGSAGQYELDVSVAGGPQNDTSSCVALGHLAFGVEPGLTDLGVAVSPPIEVQAVDDSGQVQASFTGNVTLALDSNPTGANLGGMLTMAAVAGVATFNDVTVDSPGAGYTLAATATAYTPAMSAPFSVRERVLRFVQVIPDGTAGDTLPGVLVEARDGLGGVDTTFTGDITVSLPSGSTAALLGTTTVPAVAGVSTFPDLVIQRADTAYVLVATATGWRPDTSGAFRVDPAAAAELLQISGDGQLASPSQVLPDSLVIKVVDAFGNGVTGVPVGWSVTAGGGSLAADTVASDSAGFSMNEWTVGAAGSQAAEAAVLGLTGSPVGFSAEAGTVVSWTNGAGDGLWSSPLNWDANRVPGVSDLVVVDCSARNPSIDVSATVAGLVVENGAGTGTCYLLGDITVSGTMTVNAGTQYQGNPTVSRLVNRGQLTILTLNGDLHNDGYVRSGNNSTAFTINGQVTTTPGSAMCCAPTIDRGFVNHGALRVAGGSIGSGMLVNSSTGVIVTAATVFNPSPELTGALTFDSLVNQGLIDILDARATGKLVGAYMENQGTLKINAPDSMTVAVGTFVNAATFDVSSSTELGFVGDTLRLNPGNPLSVGNGTAIGMSIGAVSLGDPFTVDSSTSFVFQNGTLTVGGNLAVASGASLGLRSVTVAAGSLLVASPVTLRASTINAPVRADAFVTVEAGTTILADTLVLTSNATLNLSQLGAVLESQTGFENPGLLQFATTGAGVSPAVNIVRGRLVNATGGNITSLGVAGGSVSGVLENHGTVSTTGGPFAVTADSVRNQGTITLPAAGGDIMLNTSGSFTNAVGGTITVESGRTLTVGGGGAADNHGVITGTGTLDVTNAVLTNFGTVAPGTSPGVLSITGDVTFDVSGTLIADVEGAVRGSEHDGLDVTGTAALGGRLLLRRTYALAANDSLALVNYGSSTGTFDSIEDSTSTADSVSVLLRGTGVILRAFGAGPATVTVNGGDNQSANVSTAVPVAPSVIVRDGSTNPAAGVEVVFRPSGNGQVTGTPDTTDASGLATVGSWTLGTMAQTDSDTLWAVVAGVDSARFLATANAVGMGTAATVTLAPSGQLVDVSGPAGALTATVRDSAGVAFVSPTVTWTSLNPAVATVDQSGTVTGVSAGQVVIQAVSDTAKGYAVVNVTDVNAAPINLWAQELDTTLSLRNIHGLRTDKIFAVGDGAIIRFDGTAWNTGQAITGLYSGLWVVSDTFGLATTNSSTGGNAWMQYDGTQWTTGGAGWRLLRIWGSAPNDVLGPEYNTANLRRFDGTPWILESVTTSTLWYGTYGTAADHVFIFGGDSPTDVKVRRFDGALPWSDAQPIAVGGRPRGAWGVRPDSVFFAGEFGKVFVSRTIGGWTDISPPSITAQWSGIWGTSEQDIYVVGSSGQVARFDGSAWTVDTLPAPIWAWNIWGNSDGAWLVGTGTAQGTGGSRIYRGYRNAQLSLDGGSGQSAEVATAVTTPPSVLVSDMFATAVPGASVDFVASGDGIVVGTPALTDANGIATVTSWTLGTTAGAVSDTLFAILQKFGGISDTVPIVAAAVPAAPATIIVSPSAAALEAPGSQQFSADVRDVYGNVVPDVVSWSTLNPNAATIAALDSATGSATAVDAGQTSVVATVGGLTAQSLLTVSVPASALLNAAVRVWVRTQTPLGGLGEIRDIWGPRADKAFGVGWYQVPITGDSSLIQEWNGSTWSIAYRALGPSLQGVWGFSETEAWAVGLGGTMVHYSGGTWADASGFTTTDLNGVWGSAPDDVWAVGAGGLIIHYDGTMWSTVTSPVAVDLNGIWGSAVDSVWAVGDMIAAGQPAILHYDGNAWSVPSGLPSWSLDIYDIHGVASDAIWLVGESALSAKFDGTSWIGVSNPIAPITGEFLGSVWASGRDEVWATGDMGSVIIDRLGSGFSTSAALAYAPLWGAWGTALGDPLLGIGGFLQGYYRGVRGAQITAGRDTTLSVGQMATLTPIVVQGVDTIQGIVETVQWTTSNPSVATVSSNGVVSAVATGTAYIGVLVVGGGPAINARVDVQ